ncbi:MAG: aminotransferase class V-fold PLP-dependent enzyme [Coriobacteriia bacterium]
MRPLPSRDLRRFEKCHPEYRETYLLDRLRRREYSRLDRLDHTYLDYTGGSLYGDSQISRHHEFLRDSVLGNPHSHNPTSAQATALADKAREDVLRFFNASPAEYDVVFTANASTAIKLVGEAYPFDERSCYLMTVDNHNSINGVREFARRAGARTRYVPVIVPALRLDEEELRRNLNDTDECHARLFAYPAQSNYSGVRHSLKWIDLAHEAGWDVLCDCATFVPTNSLDLSSAKADYVPVSFYKMFGYPTGVGALIARHEALAKLERPWFSGGTIVMVSVQNGWFRREQGHIAFEDGTIDYTNLPAVSFGIEYLERIGVDLIHVRVAALTAMLLEAFPWLLHSNGRPLVRVYGPTDCKARGGTIALGLFDSQGHVFDVEQVERLAAEQLISIRTGCFCNPGDREAAHGVAAEDLQDCFVAGRRLTPEGCNADIFRRSGRFPSSIRVSLGIASNYEDCARFLSFLEGFLDVRAEDVGGRLYSAEQVAEGAAEHRAAEEPAARAAEPTAAR